MKHMYQPCEDYTYLNHKFTFLKEAAAMFCVFIHVLTSLSLMMMNLTSTII